MYNKKPLLVMVFVHDDLDGYDIETLYKEYFGWFKSELENVTQRDVAILLVDKTRAPELTRFDYQDENELTALLRWTDQISGLIYEASLTQPYDLHLNKFLLLTRHNINSGVRGIASIEGHCAIAAINSYRNAAHEIGHMFGATHEDSEIVYDGWWNDTLMSSDDFSGFRGNAYHFSEKNKENILNYLSPFD